MATDAQEPIDNGQASDPTDDTGMTNTAPTEAPSSEASDAEEQAAFTEFAQLLEGSEPGHTTASADLDPPPEPAQPTAPQPTAAQPAAGVWDGLSDAQRAELERIQREKAKAEHAFESNRHRLAAYHRKLNATEAELQQYKQQAGTPPQPVAGAQPPAQPATTDEGASVDLTKFKEDFPEVYAAMRSMQTAEVAQLRGMFERELQQVKSQVGEVSQPIQQLNEERQEVYRRSQQEALSAAHPDWPTIEKDPSFWQWIDSQTDGIKALASSLAAEDNIMLLNTFKQHKGIAPTPPAPTRSSPQTAPAPHRPRQPEASEQLPRAGTARPSALPDTGNEDAMWDYWAKQANSNRI